MRVPSCLFVSLFDIKQKVVWFMYLPYNGIKFLQVALIIYVNAKLYFSASLKSMPGTSYAEIPSMETEL